MPGERDPGVGLDQGEAARAAAGVRRRRGSRRTPWTRPAPRARRGRASVESWPPRVASTQHRNAAHRHRRADRPAAAVAEPVEERPDQRRHDRERQHRQARGTAPPGRGPRRSGTWKNRVPASEIATAASPAVLKACISISRDSPESPAPSARGGAPGLHDGVAAGAAGGRAGAADAARGRPAPCRARVHGPGRARPARAPSPAAAGRDRVRAARVPGGASRCGALMAPSCPLSRTLPRRDTGPT